MCPSHPLLSSLYISHIHQTQWAIQVRARVEWGKEPLSKGVLFKEGEIGKSIVRGLVAGQMEVALGTEKLDNEDGSGNSGLLLFRFVVVKDFGNTVGTKRTSHFKIYKSINKLKCKVGIIKLPPLRGHSMDQKDMLFEQQSLEITGSGFIK